MANGSQLSLGADAESACDGLICQGGDMHVQCSGDETARSAFYLENLCNDGLGAHEFASVDKSVGGGCVAILEGSIVDSVIERALDLVVERAQSSIDDAQRVRYSFLDEE